MQMNAIVRKPALVMCLALRRSVVSFVSSASASAACTTAPTGGGEWPMYGHDLANTRSQLEETALGPSAVQGLKPVWSFSTSSTSDGTGFNSTPVVYDGR